LWQPTILAEGAGMDDGEAPQRALQPEDLDRLFLERANAGDVDDVMDLYEPQAMLAFPPGHQRTGDPGGLCGPPNRRAALHRHDPPGHRNGDIAITSTIRAGNATVEVARRQPDGTWRWMIDQPSVME
jgi:hypothetical protein